MNIYGYCYTIYYSIQKELYGVDASVVILLVM